LTTLACGKKDRKQRSVERGLMRKAWGMEKNARSQFLSSCGWEISPKRRSRSRGMIETSRKPVYIARGQVLVCDRSLGE
jgi:hypothetical protein